jgi:AraC family transcriptional regulator
MHVETESLPALRLATIRHIGPYSQIGRAFEQLHQIVTAARLPHRELVGVFYDDPQATPGETLRADAGVIVEDGVVLPQGLVEQRIPAGRYARAEHTGSYERLGDAWAEFTRDVGTKAGQPSARGFTFELYRNTPMEVPNDQLRTALYMSVAEASRYATP